MEQNREAPLYHAQTQVSTLATTNSINILQTLLLTYLNKGVGSMLKVLGNSKGVQNDDHQQMHNMSHAACLTV